MKIPASKSPTESEVMMTELVLPSHTNAIGTIFGGTVMSWIDIAAAISAQRHARKVVVTASVDALNFIAPIKLGYIVHLKACVNYAGKTSMEIGVRVDSEDPLTGKLVHNLTAYTTFVALDKNGKPTPVPPVLVRTPNEKRRHQGAIQRRQSRVALAELVKKL